MDNAVETKNVKESKPVRRSGLFSRFGMMAAILGCFITGAAVLVAIQSKLLAQSERTRARQAAVDATERRQPQAVSRLADNPSVSFPSRMIPSEAVPNNVPRFEQTVVTRTDPNTGDTYQEIRRSPIGHSSSRDANVELAIEAELVQLARQFRNATPANQESISQTLTQKLSEVFEARHQEQVSRAERLRAELKETQELLEKRVQLKSKIIERRLKELTGQQDELSWNPQVADSNPIGGTGSYLPVPSPIGEPGSYPPVPMDNTYPQNLLSPPISSSGSLQKQKPPMLDQSQMGGLPVLPLAPKPTYVPLSAQPSLDSPDDLPPPTSPSPSEKESKTDAPRSFMAAGFKLKKLMRELEDAKGSLGNAHPQLLALQKAFDEAKSIWDFETQTLTTELEASESELAIVQMQRDIAIDQQKRIKQSVAAGNASVDESSVAERNVLAAEREMLQLRFRNKSAKNAIQWANDFEEKSLKPPRQAPARF